MYDQDAQSIVDYIHGARVFGEKKGLDNTRALLGALGNPQDGRAFVHVAGTNGKGSTCALLESCLRACGLKTGLYTSPYLTRYNERVRVNGAPITDETLAHVGARVREAAQALEKDGVKPTSFELGTALALLAFWEADTDIAVIETGIGGRLDPTNVIAPRACAVCTIARDHVEQLGGDVISIAGEKAGIIKEGVPLALYPQTPEVEAVFEKTCRDRHARLCRAQDVPFETLQTNARGADFSVVLPGFGRVRARVNLPGDHQAQNARLALLTLSLLKEQSFKLDAAGVEAGMEKTVWPGRLEWARENLLLDGAHNPQGARALRAYLDKWLAGRRIVLLTAMMADKQPEMGASILAGAASDVVATQVDSPRALPAQALAGIYRAAGARAEAAPNVQSALSRAQALCGADGVVLAAGSLYLVGEVRGLLGLPI